MNASSTCKNSLDLHYSDIDIQILKDDKYANAG